jgi:hypothetical protein
LEVYSMTRVREIIAEAVKIADSNIDDPVSMRENKDERWIYDHFPKYGQGNTLPRIGFHKVTTQHSPFSVGDITSKTDADVQASIMVRKKKGYDIDGDGNAEPAEDVADYLHQKVKDAIEDNQDQISNLGDDVAYLRPTSSDTIKPEGKNVMLEALTFELVKYS